MVEKRITKNEHLNSIPSPVGGFMLAERNLQEN